jgi:hypothetical protein
MASWLFYGPNAFESSLEFANKLGKISKTITEDKFLIEHSRDLVSSLGFPPLGSSRSVIVAGYLDRATTQASDVLLKTLEDHDKNCFDIILYSSGLGGVSPTIKSRCHLKWCYKEEEPDWTLLSPVTSLLTAYENRNLYSITNIVYKNKKQIPILIETLIWIISHEPNNARLYLWESLREILMHSSPPTWLELLSAMMPR